jgi:TRAP-type C4-dicarboxylate transport system permease small subunit
MSILKRIFLLCSDFAGLVLVLLMSTTVADVIGRRFGLLNVRGIIEISTMTVVLIGFLALARSFVVGGHIIVDLVTAWLPRRVNDRIDAIAMVIAALCLSFLAFLMWRATTKNYNTHAISLDLQIPMVIFWLPAAAGVTLAPIACTMSAYRKWVGKSGEESNVFE